MRRGKEHGLGNTKTIVYYNSNMKRKIEQFDTTFILFLRQHGIVLGRIALFIIFFWFGILKVFLLSPAGPLVNELLVNTFLKFIEPDTFQIGFGVFEVIIGIMILFPKIERITFLVMGLHLITTALPLFLLTATTWSAMFVPTLVGQYIIKNLALLSLGILLLVSIKPMSKTHRFLAEEE